MTIGVAEQLVMQSVDSRGTAATLTAEWTSTNPEVVRVEANGTVHAVGHGTATIRATAGGRLASTDIETHPAAFRVRLKDGGIGVEVGRTHELIAEFLDFRGAPVDVRADVVWSDNVAPSLEHAGPPGHHRAAIRPLDAGPIDIEVKSEYGTSLTAKRTGLAARLRLTAWSLSDARYPVVKVDEYAVLHHHVNGFGRFYYPDLVVTALVDATVTQVTFLGQTAACADVPLKGGAMTPLFDYQPYDFGWIGASAPGDAAPVAEITATLKDGRRVTTRVSGALVPLTGIQDRQAGSYDWTKC
jgi:hypothetical protein